MQSKNATSSSLAYILSPEFVSGKPSQMSLPPVRPPSRLVSSLSSAAVATEQPQHVDEEEPQIHDTHSVPTLPTHGVPSVPTLPLRADVLLSHTLFEEFDDQGISVEFLQRYLAREDIEEAEALELQVDTAASQRVECLGELMPKLEQLRLNQSYISSIRDLGTSLTRLRVLWISRCGLQDLSGVVALPLLEELFAAFNDIKDVTPLYTHETLQVLDLEGNLLDELDEIAALESITTLRELTLAGNPIWNVAKVTRTVLLDALQGVEVLDDVPRESEGHFSKSFLPEEPKLDEDLSSWASTSLDFTMDDGSAQGSLQVVDPQTSAAIQEFHQRCIEVVTCQHDSGGRNGNLEPSEHDLVLENIRRKAAAPQRHKMMVLNSYDSSRSSRPPSSFRPDSRRSGGKKPRHAWCSIASSSASTSYRPGSAFSDAATSCSIATLPSLVCSSRATGSEDTSSDLTVGEDGGALVGTALAAVRRRRKNAGEHLDEAEINIRELLTRYQASADGTTGVLSAVQGDALKTLSAAPLEEAAELRPCTPDVRIRRSRPVTTAGRGAAYGIRENAWAPDTLDLDWSL